MLKTNNYKKFLKRFEANVKDQYLFTEAEI